MKIMRGYLFTCLALLLANGVFAQLDSNKIHKVAIFTPLYLDSAFDNTNSYRYGKNFPKFLNPGLEFYEGASIALDSLGEEGLKLQVAVYDTRSNDGSVSNMISRAKLDSVDLIIGSVNGTEYKQLADLALKKNIPFISATYPNDAGVTGNPYLVIVNSKLNTHLTSVYNYLLKNFPKSRILLLRRNNPEDDRIVSVFKSLNTAHDGPGVLNFYTVSLPDNFTSKDLLKNMDTLRQNILIVGSLDENFARNVANQSLEFAEKYPITIVGMPTWEGIKDFDKPEYKTLPIVYSSTFFNPVVDKWSQNFSNEYRRRTYSRPSDMAFKGYEITYYFIRLLEKYNKTLMSNLTDNSFRLITEYEFRPVQWNKTASGPDYYENKRIYILKKLNGMTIRLY
jgi:ABC-type branched-subunit amino acid transport system substrate-binding protein